MITSRTNSIKFYLILILTLLFITLTQSYQVLISDSDEIRQVCSGMWGEGGGVQDPFIEVIFSASSRGQLALVIFEWEDAKYLGIDQTGTKSDDAWSDHKVYICTLTALDANLCQEEELGKFIITTPQPSMKTSIYTRSVQFDPTSSSSSPSTPEEALEVAITSSGPFRYKIFKTGFYCVGTVPVTVDGGKEDATSFSGVVDFENVFIGRLAAAEYPKIAFYRNLFLVYLFLGTYWSYLCFKHKLDLIAIQWYILGTISFLIIEMFVMWSWYNYLNNTGHEGVTKILLVIVSILNAGRNSLSFFMLLITAMGYGVVKPSLGPMMLKVRILAVVHFGFGVLYSLGTVSVPLESAGFFIFFFVFPLAFTLTAFLMWIMWSLNTTIADLDHRKQVYKKSMFTRLYRILLCAVIVIGAFFILTSLTFSSRLNEDFIPSTWQKRWILLDGLLGLLYLIAFCSIAWLWRPTGNNKRLGLSDELPQGEEDDDDNDELLDEAEEFEVEDTEGDNGHSSSSSRKGLRMKNLREDQVVFDVGDEDEEDEDEESGVGMSENKRLRGRRNSIEDKGSPPSYRG